MSEPKKGKILLRIIWGLFPWLIVAVIVLFISNQLGQIKEKKTLIEEERKAAIKEEVQAVRVITLTLESKRLEDKIDLPAEIEPFEDLMVKSEVPGQVVNVLVREGEKVQAGQILVELDDRDYVFRIERIEANYSLAKADHQRMSELVRKKISASTDLDKLEAQVKGLAAQLKEARLALDRTRIVAPINGQLNEIYTKTGDFLGVDKPVAQILQFDKVKVTVGVPESDVAAVFDLTEAEVVIDALGGHRVKGKKIFLSSQPRTLARLYNLELMIPNPTGRILPGMFARVELVKKVFNDGLSIPLYAVITQDEESFVYVEDDNKAEKRPVRLGVLMDWQIHVKSGLKPAEKVIIVGHRLLDNGQDVEVIKNVNNPEEIL